MSHLAARRRSDIVMASVYTSQGRRRYVSNETPNDVSVERFQEVVSTTSYWNVVTTSQ